MPSARYDTRAIVHIARRIDIVGGYIEIVHMIAKTPRNTDGSAYARINSIRIWF